VDSKCVKYVETCQKKRLEKVGVGNKKERNKKERSDKS